MITVGRNNFKEKQAEIKDNLEKILKDVIDGGNLFSDIPVNVEDKEIKVLEPLKEQFVGWYNTTAIEIFKELGVTDVTVIAEVDHLIGHPKLYLVFPKAPKSKGDQDNA